LLLLYKFNSYKKKINFALSLHSQHSIIRVYKVSSIRSHQIANEYGEFNKIFIDVLM